MNVAPPRPRPWWKVPPLDRVGLGGLAAAYVALTVVFTAAGLAVVRWGDTSRFGDRDADVNRWLEARRTETWTELAELGSLLSDTLTKILLCLALLPVCLWLFRRWHDWALLTGGLLLEVSVFGTTSVLVGRDRPPVEQLDGAPTDSFPSGHIAAAVVFYGGLAMVIMWHTRTALARSIAGMLAVVVPSVVAASRMYLGMHYPSDAIAGALLGIATLVVLNWAVHRTIDARQPAAMRATETFGTPSIRVAPGPRAQRLDPT